MFFIFRFDDFGMVSPETACITFPPTVAVTGVACALMGESKLCMSPSMDHMDCGNSGCECLETLHHTRTHTLHLFCTQVFVEFCDFHPPTKTLHTPLFLRCVMFESCVVIPKKPSSPNLLSSQPSLLLVCCFAAYTSPPHLPPSQPCFLSQTSSLLRFLATTS